MKKGEARSIRYYEKKLKKYLAENDVYGVYECFRKLRELEKLNKKEE